MLKCFSFCVNKSFTLFCDISDIHCKGNMRPSYTFWDQNVNISRTGMFLSKTDQKNPLKMDKI